VKEAEEEEERFHPLFSCSYGTFTVAHILAKVAEIVILLLPPIKVFPTWSGKNISRFTKPAELSHK
jgi:hypothetical protein